MRQQRAPDEVFGRIAARQHGVVTMDQLIRSGITSSGISRRVAAGRLYRVHRGVYAVGHRGLSQEGRWMAAVKALGPGAMLSHRSAAAHWRIAPRTSGPIDVTVAGRNGRRTRPGVRIHRASSLSPSQCTVRDAIPVTSPSRTLEDLRHLMPASQFAAALREAEVLGLPIESRASAELDQTRSELERRLLRLCRQHRVPVPEVNVQVGPYLVDFLWRDRRLIVEVDGYRFHRGRVAFEDDRARDVELKLCGYEVLRFTYRQVGESSSQVAQSVRALLR
jgi:very-short-patch-repair endonuclease